MGPNLSSCHQVPEAQAYLFSALERIIAGITAFFSDHPAQPRQLTAIQHHLRQYFTALASLRPPVGRLICADRLPLAQDDSVGASGPPPRSACGAESLRKDCRG